MIKQYPLFFERKLKLVYYVGECFCERCEKEISRRGHLYKSWSKKQANIKLLCDLCINKVKDYGIVKEKVSFIVVPSIPENTHPYLITPPDIVDGDGSKTVFSFATENIDGERVVDRTRLAGRESFEGARIGMRPDKVDNKDRLATDHDLKLLLEAKPVEDEKPLLE